jgi:hypothetical protein
VSFVLNRPRRWHKKAMDMLNFLDISPLAIHRTDKLLTISVAFE